MLHAIYWQCKLIWLLLSERARDTAARGTSSKSANMMSTETARLIRDGGKGLVMEVGVKGDYYTYRYAVTTRMTPALRWAGIRTILMFHSLIVRD